MEHAWCWFDKAQHYDIMFPNQTSYHIRPQLVENTGSRPLPHRQAAKRRISSWVGDDQRIPGVVCLLLVFDLFVVRYISSNL
jgi:hypothetical protein